MLSDYYLLQNNIDQGLPVRVIRGHKCGVGGHQRKIYTYDGLYKVEHTYEFKVCLLLKNCISILKSMKIDFV